MTSLNPQQKRFVEEYLIDLNATQAAIRAGYSKKTAKAQGSRLLTHVDVVAAVTSAQKARTARTEVNQDYVVTGLVAEAELKGEGSSSPARIRALELLGKHVGMFTEKHEHSGPNGGPIPFERVERVIVDPNPANTDRPRVPAAAAAGPQ